MQRSLLSRATRLLLIPLALLAAACAEDATTPGGGMPKNLAPGIYPLFSVAAQGPGAAVIHLRLERVSVPGKVASYQGEITFDTGVLTLKETELPEGVVGTAREVAPGRIRFSGAAPDGIDAGPVLIMRFGRSGDIRRETFKLNVEEVADADFGDLTGKVSAMAPFFEAR